MARAGAHRVIQADEGQGADRVSFTPELVHLGDLLVERTAGERDTERVLLIAAGLEILEALRAGVFFTVVAKNAVVRLPDDFASRHARIRELEALAPAPAPGRTDPFLGAVRARPVRGNQARVVDCFGQPERNPARDGGTQRRVPHPQVAPGCVALEDPLEEAEKGFIGARGLSRPHREIVSPLERFRADFVFLLLPQHG